MVIKELAKIMIVASLFLLAIGAAYADVEEVSQDYFTQHNAAVIDFEDAELFPETQYALSHNVKFVGRNSQAVRINDYNRQGDRTASGQYSIMNDALFPQTSTNVPFVIRFDSNNSNNITAVGFYLGNGNENGYQVNATITVYGLNNQVLGTVVENKIANPVTTFVGFKATEPISEVHIDYGPTAISEDIDDVMFVGGSVNVVNREVAFNNSNSLIGNQKVIEKKTVTTSNSKQSCTDSDKGRDYKQAGTVTLYDYGGVKKSDSCWDNKVMLQEYVCDNGNYLGDHSFDCSSLGEGYGCERGACVQTTSYKFVADADGNCDAAGGDGFYSLEKGCTLKHDSGLKLKVEGYDLNNLKLSRVPTEEVIVFQAQREVRNIVFEDQTYEVEYNFYDPAQQDGRVTIRIMNVVETPELIVEVEEFAPENPVLEDQDGWQSYESTTINSGDSEDNKDDSVIIGNSCNSGCSIGGRCVPIGTRLAKEKNMFCSVEGTLEVQQELATACQNNYECGSNQCANARCADLEEKLAEAHTLLDKIRRWLGWK